MESLSSIPWGYALKDCMALFSPETKRWSLFKVKEATSPKAVQQTHELRPHPLYGLTNDERPVSVAVRKHGGNVYRQPAFAMTGGNL